MAWRFRKPHVPWNDGPENLRSKETGQVGCDLLGECGPFVVHGEENAFNCQGWVEGAAYAHECVEEFGYPFQGQVLTLYGNQHGITCRKGVHGEQVECWWTIEEGEVVLEASLAEEMTEPEFAAFGVYELDGSSHQVPIGGNEIELVYLGFENDS